jgi:hypothetical protein
MCLAAEFVHAVQQLTVLFTSLKVRSIWRQQAATTLQIFHSQATGHRDAADAIGLAHDRG